jgi:hypothetical protein
MKWSKVAQFLLGSFLGIAILVGSALGAGYFLIKRLSQPPPRPVFDNDRAPVKASTSKAKSASADKPQATTTPESTASP